MNDKLRDAIDHIQDKPDDNQLIDYSDARELQMVLEAAWCYWESTYSKEYDGY